MKIISKNRKTFLRISKAEWNNLGKLHKWAIQAPDPEKVKQIIKTISQLSKDIEGLAQQTSGYAFAIEQRKLIDIYSSMKSLLGIVEKNKLAPPPVESKIKTNKIKVKSVRKYPEFIDQSKSNENLESEKSLRYERSRNPIADLVREYLRPDQKVYKDGDRTLILSGQLTLDPNLKYTATIRDEMGTIESVITDSTLSEIYMWAKERNFKIK